MSLSYEHLIRNHNRAATRGLHRRVRYWERAMKRWSKGYIVIAFYRAGSDKVFYHRIPTL